MRRREASDRASEGTKGAGGRRLSIAVNVRRARLLLLAAVHSSSLTQSLTRSLAPCIDRLSGYYDVSTCLFEA